MRLQVLLSAMNLNDAGYIDTLNITSDAVVINQCDRNKEEHIQRKDIEGNNRSITYIETTDRGLSKSRNTAIDKADADICILCDNDVEYVSDYKDSILKGFDAHPDADIVIFYIKRKEKPVPNYPEPRRMGYLSVLKIFSPEIAFRRESIKGIRFDERFGAGSSKYMMGEENIFLYDCLKKGLKIYYEPVQIASLREEPSTWFKGYNRDFFVSRGANYAAMSAWFSCILIWQFALRKRNEYGSEVKMFDAVKYMFAGRRELLKNR